MEIRNNSTRTGHLNNEKYITFIFIIIHIQAALNNEANTDNLATPRPSEHGPTLIKGQFSRPALLLKAKAPKLNPGIIFIYDVIQYTKRVSLLYTYRLGSNNIQQLMKSTDSSVNVGQGTNNHLYTQQVIDAKNILIKELVAPTPKVEGTDRHMIPPKPETPTPMYNKFLTIDNIRIFPKNKTHY